MSWKHRWPSVLERLPIQDHTLSFDKIIFQVKEIIKPKETNIIFEDLKKLENAVRKGNIVEIVISRLLY